MAREEVMLVEEMAKILHMTPNTLYRKKWREKTGCPLRKKGKRRFALTNEFWSWMKA